MKEKALFYGELACNTIINRYLPEELPPVGDFHYHQGVFLSGVMNIYDICKKEYYFEYIKKWVDCIVYENGVIHWFVKGSLDDYMAGLLLFPLYEKTKEKKYIDALHLLMGNIKNWCRNSKGGFWHKEWLPNQMWLDGLYMVGPLQAIYGTKYKEKEFLEQAINQAYIMYENMQDSNTKLLYHAWDEDKNTVWANKETGLSSEFWGRSIGWYVVAILDIMESMDEKDSEYLKLSSIVTEVLKAIINYRDEKRFLWYQVVDKGNETGNWLESSCSCLFVYAIAKSIRMGLLEPYYLKLVKESFMEIINNFVKVDNLNNLWLNGICIGTGVNDYKGYIERPTSVNDLHGMGAFLLMCAELCKVE